MSMSTGWQHYLAGLFVAWCLLVPSAEAKNAPNRDEVATITGTVVGNHKILKGLDQRVVISSVDHVPVAMLFLDPTANTIQTLKPGRHLINVKYSQLRWISTGRMWIDAEAGKAYRVHARAYKDPERFDAIKVQFWIQDDASGAMVGGVDQGDEPKAGSAAPAAAEVTAPAPGAAEETAAVTEKPAAPEYSLATISGSVSKERTLFGGPVQRVHITCIDDIEVSDILSVSFQPKKHTLLAGKHHICVKALNNSAESSGKLWITAEPGKTYVIRQRPAAYTVYFWVEDAATHQSVANTQ